MSEVVIDINKSQYNYTRMGITFYFSSRFYLENFKAKNEEYLIQENLKFELRYKVPINMHKYFLIALYQKIEKRGFRIKINGLEYNNPPLCEVIL